VKCNPEGYDRRLVAELWMYPDNSMLLELSTRCAPSEAFQMGMELRNFLTSWGIDLTGEQATRTKKVLGVLLAAPQGCGRVENGLPGQCSCRIEPT